MAFCAIYALHPRAYPDDYATVFLHTLKLKRMGVTLPTLLLSLDDAVKENMPSGRILLFQIIPVLAQSPSINQALNHPKI